MRRRLLEEEAHAQATESGRTNNWHPERQRRPALSIIEGFFFDSTALMDFPDKQPFQPSESSVARR
jgi:hypothetical protein